MAGTTTNYGWSFVNSGTDPVSGPDNFAFVPQIDATLAGITGGLVGIRTGLTLMEPDADGMASASVTWPALPEGAELAAVVTSRTTRPDLVGNESFSSLTNTGMQLYAFRSSSTTWSLSWVVFAFAGTS